MGLIPMMVVTCPLWLYLVCLAFSCSYILSVLDQLIVDDYIIVYLHSGAPHNSMPSLPVVHRLYKTIDRRYSV